MSYLTNAQYFHKLKGAILNRIGRSVPSNYYNDKPIISPYHGILFHHIVREGKTKRPSKPT